MDREEKIEYLIDQLLAENPGYASIPKPVDMQEKRRLLRSLMNVRFPGPVSPEVLNVQDKLLQEELDEKGVVDVRKLPVIGDEYPCTEIKNADRIILWQGDITRLRADAVVNAANSQLMGCFVPCHGCIDNAIHSAAGLQLRNECAKIMEEQGHEEPAGKAKITAGYNLPAGHVIHTVGPIVGGKVTNQQIEQLKSCYESCLKLAERHSLKSIAFCCISTGEFHFPNKLAAEIAIHVIDKYLSTSNVERVVINVYKNDDYNIYKKIFR
ncbi:protein-ADP-ribose hydrolase [Dorea sp. D27]|uniref:protein-ADP-ribose hydrolase n=1 Tax=Dorea sp. D27 TaxID=658665 RepID=UPI0006734C23|nr:protein-ADP-ribose hydrolase [Dorea sp. D27]KMZ53853.1 appr-1-p processing enzyme family domain protein [Dorea sp. D27]